MKDMWTASSPGVGLNKYEGDTAEADARQAAATLTATGHRAYIHYLTGEGWVLAARFEAGEEVPLAHLWLCGCLRNDAGAHRVGCPEYPEGVEGR